MNKKNPVFNAPDEFNYMSDTLEENLAWSPLPSDPKGFLSWAPETYQINFHSIPLSKNYQFSDIFLSKDYWDGRIVYGMRITALDPILKSKDKTLVAGLQYQVFKDKDKIEVHFMATRPKWRKVGVMSFLIHYALNKHGVSKVEYWHPTKPGEKFGKKRKIIKNPRVDNEQAKLFVELARLQRNEPEDAMLKIAKISAGVLSFVVEHAGDLIHRMSERADLGHSGREYVCEKVSKVLATLTHRYGFEREFQENIVSNAKYWGIKPEPLKEKIYLALIKYAEEHDKLPAYNNLHRLAKKITHALGHRKWQDAIDYLKIMRQYCDDKDTFDKMAFDFDP